MADNCNEFEKGISNLIVKDLKFIDLKKKLIRQSEQQQQSNNNSGIFVKNSTINRNITHNFTHMTQRQDKEFINKIKIHGKGLFELDRKLSPEYIRKCPKNNKNEDYEKELNQENDSDKKLLKNNTTENSFDEHMRKSTVRFVNYRCKYKFQNKVSTIFRG